MLRQTFVHIRGVGFRREEGLWRHGVRSWEELTTSRPPPRFPRALVGRIEREIDRSAEAFRRRDERYFARRLPGPEHWRAWRDFRDDAVFLDIETTGLSIGRDAVTVVGLYDGTRARSFVKGDNLEDFPAALERAKLLVTFNGSRFDLPFLVRAFPRIRSDRLHLDLAHPLRRLGFMGGLKAVEARMGIERSDETARLRGTDAVRLWHAYEGGDEDALDLLREYNLEDVRNLEPLADFAYEGLRSLCLEGGFVTADRYSTVATSVRLSPM